MTQKILGIVITFLLTSTISYGGRITNYFEKYGNYNGLTEKAKKSLHLWDVYLINDLDSVSILGKDILSQGVKEGNQYAITVGKLILGSYLIRNGESDRGIQYLKDSRSFFERHEDYDLLAQTLSEIGSGHLLKGEAKESIQWFRQSIKIGKLASDPTMSFMAELNMARAYITLNSLPKAFELLKHYKSSALKYNKYGSVASAYTNLGILEQTRGNANAALEHYRKSIKYNLKSASKVHASHGYNNLAIVYFGLGKTDLALENFKLSLELRRESNSAKGILESYFNLGGFYLETGKYDLALENYTIALELAEKNNFPSDKADVYYCIAEVYKLQNNYVKAMEYMDLYSDELIKFNKINQKDLISANDFTWKLEHDLLKRKMKMQEEELQAKLITSRYQFLATLVALILLAGFSVFFGRKYVKKSKALV